MKHQSNELVLGREGVFQSGAGSRQRGSWVEMPYSGIRTFLRRPPSVSFGGVDHVVYGVPFDLSTSGRSGARMGPAALREASTQLAWGKVWPWNFDPFDRSTVVDAGDVPFRRGQSQDMITQAVAFAQEIVAAGAGTIMLGGDHCTTYTALKAHAEKHGPLAFVQFDAHRDTQSSPDLDHGTFVHHAMEEGLIDPERSIQIGIRTYYDHYDRITILYRDWLHEHGWRGALQRIRDVVGDRPTYLSLDIDSLDPAFAPGTGTPVVDGLAPTDIISILRETSDINFIGMDLVEVAPPYDHAGTTALIGASLILEYICARAARLGEVA